MTASAQSPTTGDQVAVRDDEAVRHFVEHMAMEMADAGFPRMPGRVLMTMMAADEDSITAAELAERLAVSPAAISGAVRHLLHLGLLARVPVPGSRRDRYQLPDDVWYQSSVTKTDMLTRLADIADDGAKALGGPETPSGRRVSDMRDFFTFSRDELAKLLERWAATRPER